jgi:hypothetical protein
MCMEWWGEFYSLSVVTEVLWSRSQFLKTSDRTKAHNHYDNFLSFNSQCVICLNLLNLSCCMRGLFEVSLSENPSMILQHRDFILLHILYYIFLVSFLKIFTIIILLCKWQITAFRNKMIRIGFLYVKIISFELFLFLQIAIALQNPLCYWSKYFPLINIMKH